MAFLEQDSASAARIGERLMQGTRRTFGLKVRKYGADDFDAVRNLYTRVWKEQRGLAYDKMRMRDTYDGLPIATVAHFEEDLAGFFTIWPMPLTDGTSSLAGGQAMDVMTDDRFRGKGVFPALATQAAFDALDRGIKLLFGVPNDAIFSTYLKRLAWASPTTVRTCVRILSLRDKHPLLAIADPLLGMLPKAGTAQFAISHDRPSAEFIARCLAAQDKGRGVWRVHKSAEWYNFRYQKNERFTYHWVALSSESVGEAFAIWGINIAQSQGLIRANLLDVVGSPTAAKAAVTASCAAAKRAGGAYMAALATSASRVKWLRNNGFFRIKDTPLITKTLDPSPFNANPYVSSGWDLFGGDFDFV